MIVATAALFFALGGTSIAATQLAKNSVGTKQLKNNAVTGAKVKDGTLGTADLSAVALSTLQGAPGPKGETGAQGPQGVQGEAGPSFVYQNEFTNQINATPLSSVALLALTLPPGKYLLQSKLVAEDISGQTRYLNCWLYGPVTGIDQSIITLSGVDEEWQTCTNMAVVEITTTGPVLIATYAESATTHIRAGKLVATKIGDFSAITSAP